MSKTVEDLKQVYIDALCASDGAISAGIAAVVRALRDDMRYMMINRDSIDDMFDKILGDAGNEKVAGSTPEGAVQTRSAKGEPPASPATDICEWEKLRNSFGFKVSCSTKWLMNENYGGDMCPLCDKRIEYKFEPATDPAPAPCLWRVHHETRNGPLYVSQCDGEWRHATADPKCPACKKEIFFVTDPAPAARSDATAVCEWLDDGNPRKRRRNSCGLQGANQSWAGMNWVCTGCLKPIKFTEAK